MAEDYPTVEQAPFWPNMCVVSCDRDGPWLDLRTKLAESAGTHGYIHVTVAEQIGRSVGMVSQNEIEAALNIVSEMQDEIHELQRQVDSLGVAKEILA